MARLISKATGMFLDASTWAVVDSTSLSDSSAETNSALTTSYQNSSGFTPGAITIDGIAIKPSAVTPAGATNTITVRIGNAGVDVAGTVVTMNVSDLPLCDATDDNGGWVFFKFSSPVTLLAATQYTVGVKLSSTSTTVNLYQVTAANWSRMLRTTTTQAPAAGDDLFIMGENTGAGTGNNFTVTMNSITNTDYGSAATSVKTPGLSVSKRGTLTCGVVAATAYLLRLSGHFVAYSGSAFNWGTNGASMPSDSSGAFEFDCASDGQFGVWLKSGSTTNIYGNSISNVQALLNANVSAAGNSLTSDISTGWKNGDVIAIASTTRTGSECESATLNGDASGTTIALTAGVTNAHGGSGNIKAELVNLTRNVKFRAVSSSLVTFFLAQKLATVTIRYAEFYYMGDDSTNLITSFSAQFGLAGTTATQDVQYCSFHDFEDSAIRIGSTTAAAITFSNNVGYNLGSTTPTTTSAIIDVGQASSVAGGVTFNNNTFLLLKGNATNSGNNGIVRYLSAFGVFQNNRFAGISGGSSRALVILDSTNTQLWAKGNVDGLVVHSSTGIIAAVTMNNLLGGFFDNFTIWRNNIAGIALNEVDSGPYFFDGGLLFGNLTNNMITQAAITSDYIFRDYVSDSDATFSTTNGLSLNSAACDKIYLINCQFSVNSAHTTDIVGATSVRQRVEAINCTFAAATEYSNPQNGKENSYFRSQKHDGSLNNTFSKYRRGTITAETSIRKTASGYSWKLAPSSSSMKLLFPGPNPIDTLKAPVAASSLVTITAWMVKNAAYNGVAARLILFGGIAPGIPDDVIDSYSLTQNTITGASNATPIVITSNSHGYSNGDRVLIEGVVGNTAANGTWTIANVATNTFELVGSVGNGAYSSGGTINKFEQLSVTGTPTDNCVVEFYFDCAGTAGAIYIDDIDVAQ